MRCGKDSHGSVGCGDEEPNSALVLLPPSKLGNGNKLQSIFGFGWSSMDAQSSKLHKVIPCSWTHFPITLGCLQECASTKILQQDHFFLLYWSVKPEKLMKKSVQDRERRRRSFGSKKSKNVFCPWRERESRKWLGGKKEKL